MPATKKRKIVKKTSSVEKRVEVMSEQMSMLLVVFSIAMMAFAFVLYKVYVKQYLIIIRSHQKTPPYDGVFLVTFTNYLVTVIGVVI